MQRRDGLCSAEPEKLYPRETAFFWQQKKARKENCRCCDAADPRLKGYSPLRIPKRKSQDPRAKRKQYYFSFLTPADPAPLLSREFPRTPAEGTGWHPFPRNSVGRGLDPSAELDRNHRIPRSGQDRSLQIFRQTVGAAYMPPAPRGGCHRTPRANTVRPYNSPAARRGGIHPPVRLAFAVVFLPANRNLSDRL